MGNYSYSEIQDMQRKAMERVREMKRNSDMVTQSAQREFNIERESIDRLSELCTYGKTRTVKSYVPLGYDEIKEIFELSY